MEAVLFTGVQASGKTSFYKEHFFTTHIRLNLDMLKTRHRLNILMHACIDAQQRFVLDNTNLVRSERAVVIQTAKDAKFRVIGYFFTPEPHRAMLWNAARTGKARVPDVAIWDSMKRLEIPTLAEGFDLLYTVRAIENGSFEIASVSA